MRFLSSLFLMILITNTIHSFSIKEATIHDLQLSFNQNKLTSYQLTQHYISQIQKVNPILRGVIEVNPDALHQADVADKKRNKTIHKEKLLFGLLGIPILLKDNIGTLDKLNTTAGSLALLGSAVARDAGVVKRLRRAGAVIIGKASMSEWANFRSFNAPSGWCARGGQGLNPYVSFATPCGSSSGSAITVAANMVAVSLGTETGGSIICPASFNSIVGIKPTVGLTSRAGVIPISPRQDTIGPMGKTVSDAVYVLDAIVGYDQNDDHATRKASKYIPLGGYKQFLKADGLKGKRLGIVRELFFSVVNNSFEHHFHTLRQGGAELVDNLHVANLDVIANRSDEKTALQAEFKFSLNEYLSELVKSPVRTLADVIAFNKRFSELEKIKEYGQGIFEASESTNGIRDAEKKALFNLQRLTRDGFLKLMRSYKLDALIGPGAGDFSITALLAIGGFPGVSVPAGYDSDGVPFGIVFGGLKGSEPKLIEIAYGFEHATKIRRAPPPRPVP